MKPVKFAALVAAVSLSTIGAAHAVVLTTAALDGHVSQHFHCNIVNVGTKDIAITNVEAIDFNGAVISSSGSFTLAPGVIPNVVNGDESSVYCRFTFKGSKTKVRANLVVADTAGDTVFTSPAY